MGPGVLPPATWVLGGAGGVQGLQRLGQAGKLGTENGDLEEKKKEGEALTRTSTNEEPAGKVGAPPPALPGSNANKAPPLMRLMRHPPVPLGLLGGPMLVSVMKVWYLLLGAGVGGALPRPLGPPEGLEATLEAAAAGTELGLGGRRLHQPLGGGQEGRGRSPTIPQCLGDPLLLSHNALGMP